jgi:Ran GTPase-activating protein 1
MDDIVAGRPEAEALEVYRILSEALVDHKLRVINLSDNAIGPKGLVPLTTLLRGREYLEEIYFCNDGISAESAQTIADLLLFRTPTKLKRIEFFNNMSGSDGAIAIARVVEASPDLEYFRFSSSRGGQEGGEALAKALETSKLQHLDLHDNTLGVDTGKMLARWLLKQTNLTYLDLGDISTLLIDNWFLRNR